MHNKFAAYFIRTVGNQGFVFFYATANTAKQAMDLIKLDGYILVNSGDSSQVVSVPYHNIAYVAFVEKDR